MENTIENIKQNIISKKNLVNYCFDEDKKIYLLKSLKNFLTIENYDIYDSVYHYEINNKINGIHYNYKNFFIIENCKENIASIIEDYIYIDINATIIANPKE